MRERRRNEGLRKRCGCPRRQWPKCRHPWHFNFQRDGRHYRVSLHKVAGKPAGYVMPKTEAEAIRDRLRGDIRSGQAAAATTPDARLTLGDVGERYLDQHARIATRGPRAVRQFECYVRLLRDADVPGPNGTTVRLGTKPVDAVTAADIEAVCARRLGDGAVTERRPKGGLVGVNRLKSRARHLFNWAIRRGYLTETPFKIHGVTRIGLTREVELPRDRRLVGDEETRLLKAANPHLQALILAALETGCRVGELLSLQWRQVDVARGVILLPGSRTKTGRARALPVTSRMRAVLEMRRTDADGEPFGPDAYVFGTETGERVACVKTAWRNTCTKAGIVGLHFHDLRREFACRLLEAPGVGQHVVRDWLGHANITTTSRYLSTTAATLQDAARKFEQARTACRPVAQSGPLGEADRPPDAARVSANRLN